MDFIVYRMMRVEDAKAAIETAHQEVMLECDEKTRRKLDIIKQKSLAYIEESQKVHGYNDGEIQQ